MIIEKRSSLKNTKNKTDYDICHQLIVELICSGDFSIGDRFLSVDKLVKRLGVGRISVQHAIRMLVDEGILETIRKKGTYIKSIPDGKYFNNNNVVGVEELNNFSHRGISASRKEIKIGILSELPEFEREWKQIFIDYMTQHPEIHIDLVQINSWGDLLNRKIFLDLDIVQVQSLMLDGFVKDGCLFDLSELGYQILEKDDFYGSTLSAASVAGKLWGVPGSVSVNCVYYNHDYKEFLAPALEETDFWKRLDLLLELSKILPENFQSLVSCNHPFHNMFFMANPDLRLSLDDIHLDDSQRFEDFYRRLGPYIQNPKIFLRNIKSAMDSAGMAWIKKETPMVMSSASWLQTLTRLCPFKFSIGPSFRDSGGMSLVEANVSTISAFSIYPEECFEILRYLSSVEAQKQFALSGKLVANQKANQELTLKGLDEESQSILKQSIMEAKSLSMDDVVSFTAISASLKHEFDKFQHQEYDASVFMESLKRKIHFFYQAMERRKNFDFSNGLTTT
jgi:DNA-binding transcriptional regulator YhcF (GntR family)